MTFLKTRKSVALVGAVVAVAIAAVGAYAYWTTGGSGSGTADVGTTTDNLEIVGLGAGLTSATNPVAIDDGLTPAGSVDVDFRIYNPNSYSVYVSDVSQDGAITNDGGAGCLTAWFSFDTVTVNETIAANSFSTQQLGAVDMSDPNVNQDDCKLAELTLTLASN